MLMNGTPVVPIVGEFLWVPQPGVVWSEAEGRYVSAGHGVTVRYLGEYRIDPASGIRSGLVEEWDGYRGRLQMSVDGTRLATAVEIAQWQKRKESGQP